MADVAFVEFLKGGAAAAAARRASTLLSGASPAASAFGTLASPLRPLVQQMQRVSAFEIRDVLVGGHEVLLARRQDGRYETCRMVLLKTFPEDKVWTLQDSLAFLVVSMRHEALEEVPRLNIVVVPGKISTKARNDAFEPRQQRVVPLSAEEVQLFAAGAEALLAAEALANIQAKFTRERMCAATLDVYRDVVGGKRNSAPPVGFDALTDHS